MLMKTLLQSRKHLFFKHSKCYLFKKPLRKNNKKNLHDRISAPDVLRDMEILRVKVNQNKRFINNRERAYGGGFQGEQISK